MCRVARRVILNEGGVKKQNVIASLLRVTSLNLWGLGGTLIGLQVYTKPLTPLFDFSSQVPSR